MEIDDLEKQLRAWVKAVVGDTPTTWGAPAAPPTLPAVNLYLKDFEPAPAARGDKPGPRQFKARYLITAWAAEPAAEHALLAELAFAALDLPDAEVDFGPLPDTLWSAFGLKPRPAFFVALPVRRQRPVRPIKRVLKPVVESGVLGWFEGLVVGPNDVPLSAVHVEVPGAGFTTRTDERGRFRFPRVPGDAIPQRVVVSCKGKRVAATVRTTDPQPAVIRINLTEE